MTAGGDGWRPEARGSGWPVAVVVAVAAAVAVISYFIEFVFFQIILMMKMARL